MDYGKVSSPSAAPSRWGERRAAWRRRVAGLWAATRRWTAPASPRLAQLAVALPAVCAFARRNAAGAWRRLGFVPSFGAGVGLLTGLGATLAGSRHALAFGFTCGSWAFILALGVGLVIHARSAFYRALDAP